MDYRRTIELLGKVNASVQSNNTASKTLVPVQDRIIVSEKPPSVNVELKPEHSETRFRVKGRAGRIELCRKLVESFRGTDTPSCALVVGNPEAADLWNGGSFEDVTGMRQFLPQPRNIVLCPMVKVEHKGNETLVGRTFSKRRSAQEIADYIYESRRPAIHWEKLNKQLGKRPDDIDRMKPICDHPIEILILIAQDGMKEFLSEVESIPNLTIYHMDACDFEAEGGIEPISDVAIFEDVAVLPYPVDIYDGTLAGEFAERCTKGNHIAKELFIEAFLTVLGAVVGNQLRGDQKGMFARQYVIAVAPPQHGKDVAIEESQEVFRAEPEDFDGEGRVAGFLNHEVDYKKIGALPVNVASENAAIDAGLKCSRLLNVPPEFGSLLDKSNISGAGKALLELMLSAWDSTFPRLSTAKGRKDVPPQLFFSILTSIQPDRLSGMQVTSGFYSRCIWITVKPLNVTANLPRVDYGDFQKRLFAKLLPLDKSPITIPTSPEALEALNTWFADVKVRKYEDDQIRTRINIIALRKALVLAWLKDQDIITEETMRAAIRFCDWQLSVRSELFLRETENDIARHQVRIRKALRKQPLTDRALMGAVNAYRVGTEIHERALRGLLSIKDVKIRVTSRKDSKEYYLPKGVA
jgi:Protein of unknown function (DUF3987)